MTHEPAGGESPRLAATAVAASEAPSRALLMLHGIYGRGRNWQQIARAVTAARPEYGAWLVDLPYHGDSAAGRHGDTIRGLAADLADWSAAQQIAPAAVLGHSFGGKVALAFAATLREHPLQVWVIDSTPEARPPSGSAWEMLALVRSLPPRFSSREEVVDAIVSAGFARGVALWMASNLVREEGGFVWRLDFDAMERLMTDFFATPLWDVIENPSPLHEIHIVKASASNAISREAVERLEAAAGDRVHVHHREGGHWIHTEAPEVVTELLVQSLP